MSRVQIASSSFTGSENPLSEGGNWTQEQPLNGNVLKVSGQATGDHSGPPSQSVRWTGAGSFTNKQYASTGLPTGFSAQTGAPVGSICNAQSGAETYYAYYIVENLFGGSSGASRTTKLSKFVAATETVLFSSSVTWSAGDLIEIENDGANIRGLKNGVLVSGASIADTAITNGTPGFLTDNSWVETPWSGGNITNDVTLALTGQGATFTPGTVTAQVGGNVTVALTGQLATFVAGLVTASGGNASLGFVRLPGNPSLSSPTNSLQFAVLRSFTTPSPDVTVGLTGQRSTFASGALVSNLALALTGQSALFAPGVMGASAGGNVTVALVGQGSVFTPGQMLAGVSIALTGQSATFTPGTVTKGISVSLVGQGATFRAGNVTPSGGTPVIGPQVTLVGFIANVGSMMVH